MGRDNWTCFPAAPSYRRHRTIVPPPDARRTPRKPSIRTFVQRAEKATGKPVTAITMPDGTKLDFGEPAPTEPESPWPLDEFCTKETKQ